LRPLHHIVNATPKELPPPALTALLSAPKYPFAPRCQGSTRAAAGRAPAGKGGLRCADAPEHTCLAAAVGRAGAGRTFRLHDPQERHRFEGRIQDQRLTWGEPVGGLHDLAEGLPPRPQVLAHIYGQRFHETPPNSPSVPPGPLHRKSGRLPRKQAPTQDPAVQPIPDRQSRRHGVRSSRRPEGRLPGGLRSVVAVRRAAATGRQRPVRHGGWIPAACRTPAPHRAAGVQAQAGPDAGHRMGRPAPLLGSPLLTAWEDPRVVRPQPSSSGVYRTAPLAVEKARSMRSRIGGSAWPAATSPGSTNSFSFRAWTWNNAAAAAACIEARD